MSTNASVQNLFACFDSFEALIADADAAAWATQSYCPDWTTHGIAAHLAGVEHVMAGWEPSGADDLPPFAKMGPFMEECAALEPAAMLARYRDVVAGRRAELSALSDEQLAAPSGTPVGPGTYGGFLSVRVFDFWVHEQDVRGPLGLPGNEAGPPAEEALQQTISSLPYIVGKKIGMEDGMSLVVNLTGPVVSETAVLVDGRAGIVAEVDNPTAVLTADSTVFQMLACGRIDPQGPIERGQISWSGDDAWGERAARNLRYTM